MSTEVLFEELEHSGPSEDERLQMSFDELVAPAVRTPPPSEVSPPPAVEPVHETPSPEPSVTVTGRHQDIRLYLTVLLKTFVEMTDAGMVRDAPYQVRLDDEHVYQPDIVFITNSSFDRMHETYVEGAPDVIVEVISPESAAQDRGEKFVTYESRGVREYWLIDPIRELANIYHLGPDDLYDDFRPDTTGRLRSRVLKGFVLDVNRLWRRVLPTTVETVEMVQRMLEQR
jgi:Uma2 family endonuclease